LGDEFPKLDLGQRLAATRGAVVGRVVFTTSFGVEDQAIADAIFTQDLKIEVVTLDTGRLFPETYEVWEATERRYSQRVRAFLPDSAGLQALVARQGVNGFRASIEARENCCAARKVEPLGRALAGASAWITGLRGEQSAARALASYASVDPRHGLLKVNPLLDWTRDRTVAFVRERGIPYNPLHDKGFVSIGCAPCTRAVAPGEPERAGRWWWEQEDKKECGLHAHHPARVRQPEPTQVEARAKGTMPWTQG